MSLSNNIVIEDNQAKLSINMDYYSINTVKRAAYKFADRCSVFLEDKQEKNLNVLFIFSQNTATSEQIQQVIADFCDELMDQDLRETIAKETKVSRNLILAQAFSKTSLIS